jgi:uncharacterized protein YcsI (UPF0317 family)
MRDLVQEDQGNRGLCKDPVANLINACPEDFISACHSVATAREPSLAIVTGFFIPNARPPCGETDGPLGALFLARALTPQQIKVTLVTDAFCVSAVCAGLEACGLTDIVPLVVLPPFAELTQLSPEAYRQEYLKRCGRITHLVALERVGPSHTPSSIQQQSGSTPELLEQFLREVPKAHHDRCHTMRGIDITSNMSPAHLLFEAGGTRQTPIKTIGIGDGGNEIGMGKISWEIIRRNIPGGARVACRVATDYLIVCGISNWGAYALAAGILHLRGRPPGDLFDPERERELLQLMVEKGPLVDGVKEEPAVSVDGIEFDAYIEKLTQLDRVCASLFDPGPRAPASAPRDLERASGAEVRLAARRGDFKGPTAGLARSYVQANLVAVPREFAFDFLLFCQRNPKPCPLLEVTEPGCPEPKATAPHSDLRTDLPRYCVYQEGQLVDEPTDLHRWWRDDLVGFLLGCSFTFENALLQAGVPLRHLEQGCNVPMYRTNIQCQPTGVFRGPMVVSMRPLSPRHTVTAVCICARFGRAHGAPVHFGDPATLGISNLDRPDFGDPVEVRPGELPVFWACGVTPQAVALESRLPLVITHKPGHMFVTDLKDTELEDE